MARNDIIVKLRLAGEQFDRDFKVKFQDLTNAADQASGDAGARAGSTFTKGFLGAAGLGALGAAIGTAISSSADLGAEIASTSRQFNIGAEQLQVWRQAAQTAGISTDNFNDQLANLTQKIGEANAGNRQAQQGFVDLGVSFQTVSGQARATDAVMLDLAKRIAAIEDPADRMRLGAQLLGDEFQILYPLLLKGADGFNVAAAEVDRFGGALSAKEIQDLQATNVKIEELKNQLSRNVAKVVADNAESINALADSLFTLADGAIKATGEFVKFIDTEQRYRNSVASLPQGLSPDQRAAAVGDLNRRFGRRETVTGSYLGGLITTKDVRFEPNALSDPSVFGSRTFGQTLLDEFAQARQGPAGSAPPRVTGSSQRRTGGGGARNPTQSAAEREAERAAKEAIRNEEQLRDAIARTLRAQEDSAEVARIRTEQGEEAAARAEAELGFLRQHPLAVNETVEALAKALGITRELTQADRDRLQLLIDQGNAAQKATGDAAAQKARAEQDREAKRQAEEAERLAEQQAEVFRRLHEQAILDVADFYEIAFRGGTKDLWRSFKDEGTRIIAEIAAQWTLAMLSGQGFNLNSALGGAMNRSPLASIFAGVGALGGGGAAANDNGFAAAFGNGSSVASGARGLGGAASRALGVGGRGGAGGAGILSGLGNIGAAIPQVGAFLALTQVSNTLGSGLADLLGVNYSKTGGSLFGALGGFIGGALKGTKRASVTVGNLGGALGITGSQGNSAARRDTANAGAGSLIDAIFQIADQLGGGVDASRGSVSFGMRKDSFRVDPTGRGITKVGNGAIDFGSDQEAAIRFAIQDLIKDGVITGISQASQNLLQRGGDLDQQIEKALLIEQIPKLLRQRLDPLGAALDDLYDKFKRVNDALIEGSASAEQIAQARQLWELEKADAIASIGAASQTLKDFLASLNAGSNSPLSLREQREEAERQLQPFIAQISAAEAARAEAERLRGSGASAADIAAAEERARTAAGAINQDGFTQASQLLLSISRQSNASSGAFFSDFDRIRALTGQAIGFVDQASARGADTRDPFGSAIAKNTQDAAYILADQTAILNRILEAINDNGVRGGPASDFIGAPRAYIQ